MIGREIIPHCIASCVGTLRDFPWGTITSEYDHRAGGSSIIIRYPHSL